MVGRDSKQQTLQSLQSRHPQRARRWQLRRRSLLFGPRPLLMGIVNVTPDSFSDGGRFFDPGAAEQQALELVQHGADLLDIGAESTRPYSTPVTVDEELRRLIPVLERLCGRVTVPISVDTSKATVARQALSVGAEIINDVTGLESDPAMLEVARETGAGVCVMHMQGTPQTMQDNPTYDDVAREVFEYLEARRDAFVRDGIAVERICLDPGIGFGKTHQHNLTLLSQCNRFHQLGCPLLVGHSRKGFIASVLGDKHADRTAGTVGTSAALARHGVQILRVHDVQVVRQALLLFEATGGLE